MVKLFFTLIIIFLSSDAFAAEPVGFNLLINNTTEYDVSELSRPTAGESVRDPVFGTTIKRITNCDDACSNFSPYSKTQVWNSDNSYMLVSTNSGQWNLHNGSTLAYIKTLNECSGNGFIGWDISNPNHLYYFYGCGIKKLDVSTNTGSSVLTFSNCSSVVVELTGGEARPTCDGRYFIAATVRTDNSKHDYHIVDLIDGEIDATLLDQVVADAPNSLRASPLGNYVLFHYGTSGTGSQQGIWALQWANFSAGTGHATAKNISTDVGHGDFGVDTDGKEIFVVVSGEDEGYNKYKFFDSAGVTTVDATVPVWNPATFKNAPGHVSLTADNLNGWALISTVSRYYSGTPCIYSPCYNDAVSDPWEQELFWIKLDGSGESRRIAHHRSLVFTVADEYAYGAFPFATSNKSGSKIVFSSNWGTWDENYYVNAYMATYPVSGSISIGAGSHSISIGAGSHTITIGQ